MDKQQEIFDSIKNTEITLPQDVEVSVSYKYFTGILKLKKGTRVVPKDLFDTSGDAQISLDIEEFNKIDNLLDETSKFNFDFRISAWNFLKLILKLY